MQAHELRVGNRVLNNGVIRKVTGLIPHGDKYIVLLDDPVTKRSLQDIHPIPLTPEILEQCGFEDVSLGKNGLAVRMMINSSDELAYWKDEGILRYQTRLSGFTRQFAHIKYLHQLQNLYFAMTGEELDGTINIEKENILRYDIGAKTIER